MTLQQLEYIVAVDEYRYFVKAAEACGVTQSTLSLMIRKVEEELDVTLFNRDTHPVEVTKIGRKVIDEAKLVLYHSRQLKEITRSEKELASGKLRLGMISTVAPVLMPGMFKYLMSFYPEIKMQSQEMRSATIVDYLKKTEIDMGIMASPVNDKDLLELPLYHERFYAYMADGKPLLPGDSVQRNELYSYPLWVMRDGVQLFDEGLASGSLTHTYEEMYEGGRVGVLIQIANENGGITLVPETHVRFLTDEMREALKPIVNPEPQRVISLVIRKDYIHEKMMNIIVQAVKSCIDAKLFEPTIKTDSIKI
ncbi:MAG: LysR family transcriptional regulator [Bacteroidales bacterium]|nr:LysR family transcriptional regulator [Bacteroidales bacterium]